MRRPVAPNGFPTVGFLLASIHTGSSRILWPEFVADAERLNVNIVCFPGGRLNEESGFEAQRNLIYDLAGSDNVDGLVSWATSLAGVLGSGDVEAFHRKYLPLPLVSLSQQILGAPTVFIDVYEGMRELISHLVEVHHYRRIAFIRGPSSHRSAEERYRAYLDTLADYGLPVLPELSSPPMNWDEGAKAARILLDERGLCPGVDFDALVAASDLLALWALKSFQARGFRVPEDFAAAGFNDTTESRLAAPPLTTVLMPFREQGALALSMITARIDGDEKGESVNLPTRLVVRRSCGCPSEAVAMASAGERSVPGGKSEGSSVAGENLAPGRRKEAELAALRASTLDEIHAMLGTGIETRSAWIEPLIDAFTAEIFTCPAVSSAPDAAAERGSPSGAKTAARKGFLAILENVLERAVKSGDEISPWQGAVSILRRNYLNLAPPIRLPFLEELFGQARVLAAEAVQTSRTYWSWLDDRLSEKLRGIGMSLLMSFDIERTVEVLAESLPELGIASAYLALYEGEGARPEYGKLVMAFSDGKRAVLREDGQVFPLRQLVPPEFLPIGRMYELVVEPLFFHERQIGYAVFEIGPKDGRVYEELRGYLSSALKGSLLFAESREARIAAEKADRLKTRLLANVSHELKAPLSSITQYARKIVDKPRAYGIELPKALESDIGHIRRNAEHQIRLIDDLLDLSRAEIDELDLYLEFLDPRPLLEEAFRDFADRLSPVEESAHGKGPDAVEWRLELPERLPIIHADPVRLRQILMNLLANAIKFTEKGSISLGAAIEPPMLHIWVSDTGAGIPEDIKDRIFQPFVTASRKAAEAGEPSERGSGGIGLGLPISRHMAALHYGTLEFESERGRGTVFHLRLPLPSLSGHEIGEGGDIASLLLLISRTGDLPKEIRDFARARGLKVLKIQSGADWEAELGSAKPSALAWDLSEAAASDWALVRRLRHHPRVFQAPLVLFGAAQPVSGAWGGPGPGLIGILGKETEGATLLELIESLRPEGEKGPILVVDDEAETRDLYRDLVASALPGFPVKTADSGEAALSAMEEAAPSLIILDLVMPGMGGLDFVDRIRLDPRFRKVPVIVLSNKTLEREDIERLEAHARVTVQSKGVWSGDEAVDAMNRSIFGESALPTHTGALVKRALLYLNRNFSRLVARWQLAEAVNTSEDYLSRIFHRELGISPWEYLNRYRVHKAKGLLKTTEESIQVVASRVGFKDQAYFSRVFKKIAGISPQAFRNSEESGDEPEN